MEWYLPMTIIPGVGLIINSTAQMLMSLNTEISKLEEVEIKRVDIIEAKLDQLKRLSLAIVFQYLAVLFLLFSGILKSVGSNVDLIAKYLLTAGIISLTASIVLLLVYAIKAVSIRQRHFDLMEI